MSPPTLTTIVVISVAAVVVVVANLVAGVSGASECAANSLAFDVLKLASSLQDEYATEPFSAKSLENGELQVSEDDVARDVSEYLNGYEFNGRKNKVQLAKANIENQCARIEAGLGSCFDLAYETGSLEDDKPDHQRALGQLAKVSWCRLYTGTRDKDTTFFMARESKGKRRTSGGKLARLLHL